MHGLCGIALYALAHFLTTQAFGTTGDLACDLAWHWSSGSRCTVAMAPICAVLGVQVFHSTPLPPLLNP